MKTSFAAALLFSITLNLPAQNAGSTFTANPSVPATDQDTPYTILQNDANSRVWERTTYEQAPSGQAVPQKHHYTELATGLNHLVKGEWVESREEIDILPNGTAQAVQGQHQAYFPGDIYEGQIELVTPDGKHLKSRPMGLSYFDGQNSVLIAELTNSVGYVIGNNEVIYPNAFTGLKADLRYTYTKAGFEQDVILHEQPPIPESLGLSPQSTRLQVLTEFFNPPQPSIQRRPLVAATGLSLTDESLGFGTMQMVPGRAFLLGDKAAEATARVSKSWSLLEGRQFLVEEVPVDAVADGLGTLPVVASNNGRNLQTASKHLALPPQRLVQTNPSRKMRLAKADLAPQGLVLDYQTVNGSLSNNYTFQGDSTYYISGNVSLNGTNNVFEGGAVLKYASNASVALQFAGVKWRGSAYHPVVLTAKDDNSVGETISGSTGNPSGYYANQALNYYQTTCPTMSYFRIAYAQHAIIATYSGSQSFYNGQIINCQYGMDCESETINLRNMLFGNVQSSLYNIFSTTLDVQNTTFSGSSTLASPLGYASLTLENCVVANVTTLTNSSIHPFTFSGDHNGFYNSSAFGTAQVANSFYPFQSVGAGSYYLANGCNFFNAGTTNIDSTLLARLKQTTTWAPIVYSNTTISAATNFSPQAQRDTDTPDLGYHYDPLDWCFGGVTANANLSFQAGTAVGYFETVSGNGYGIALSNDKTNTFIGTVTSPCVFARYSTVQEGNGNWKLRGYLAGIATVGNSTYFSQINANFTHCYALAADPNHFRDYYAQLNVQANNCEFYSGSLAGYWLGLYTTNCLYDRVVNVGSSPASAGLFWRNCTMHGGSVFAVHSGNLYWPIWIENSAFDGTTINMNDYSGGNTNITYCDYNGFVNGAQRLIVNGAHDVVTNTFAWQTGLLGNWYQPSNSILANTGSVTADLIGLYHFTTQTNQIKETNSIVDIGYHYVAVDGSGNPIDTDGDGIPDYLQDANGNGIYDSGDFSNWRGYISDMNGVVNLRVYTPLK